MGTLDSIQFGAYKRIFLFVLFCPLHFFKKI